MSDGGKLQFGICIPQLFPEGSVDLEGIASYMQNIRTLGYTSAWVQDGVIGSRPSLDPLPLLAYVAPFSGDLTLGVSVLLANLRIPIPVAKSVATLDHLTGGRILLGIGMGFYEGAYPAFGLDVKRRVSRFEEGIQVMKALWTEDKASFQGKHFQLNDLVMLPKPVQKPHPPLWFGAHSAPALRRAVLYGDGWMSAGAASTADFKGEIKLVRQFMEEEGRDPSTFKLSKRVYLYVDKDRDTAEKSLREWSAIIYQDPDRLPRTAVYGGVQDCVDGLGEVVEEGIELLMCNPVGDLHHQAEVLARDVLPKLGFP